MPFPVLPMPKKPNLRTQAIIAISMTPLIPKRFRQNGIIRMHNASLAWEMAVSAVAFFAPHVSMNSVMCWKLSMNIVP
jgi:hypothetical protein